MDGGTTTYGYTYGPNTMTASTTVSNPTLNCTQTNTCGYSTSQTSTNSSNVWKKTTYDGFGRVSQLQNGHDSTVLNTVDTVYGACACSPLGKVMKVSLPYGPGETEVWTTYTYDASGRQLTSTAPDGSVTQTIYSENTVKTIDPAGVWKTNTMDAFGNLVSVQEPDPANINANGPLTTYTYNGANQLVGVSMTRGTVTQTRSFSYSGSDLVSETTPEAGTVSYTYDGNHHVTQRTDAKGQQTQYAYDSYERLAEVRHYTPTGTNNSLVEDLNQRVDYYYDTPVASDYQQQYTWGRLSGVAFHQGTYSAHPVYEYTYNQAGRVVGNRMLISNITNPAIDKQAQYAWDDHGRMTSMTYPSGPVMNYQYDPFGRANGMTETISPNAAAVAAAATFGSNSQLLTLIYGNNITPFGETRTYNNLLQLTRVVVGARSTAGWTCSTSTTRVIIMGGWSRRSTACWAKR